MGQSRDQQSHPSHIAVIFAGLIDAPQQNFIHRSPIRSGKPVPQSNQRLGGQIIRPNRRKSAAIATNRSAESFAQEDIMHSVPSFSRNPRDSQILVILRTGEECAALTKPKGEAFDLSL